MDILSYDKDVFRVLYTNARSIIGKIDLLKSYVYDLEPAVVCICEASTNSSISDAFLNIEGYSLLVRADGTDTKDGWCRGLLIYVRVDITAARYESSIIDSMIECDGVTIPWGNKGEVLKVILAYRPPRPPGSDADNGYCDKFCDLMASLRSPAVIVGDLNFPGIDWNHLYASSAAEKRVVFFLYFIQTNKLNSTVTARLPATAIKENINIISDTKDSNENGIGTKLI